MKCHTDRLRSHKRLAALIAERVGVPLGVHDHGALALVCNRLEEKGATHEGQSDLLILARQSCEPGRVLIPRSAQVFIVGNCPVPRAQGSLVLAPISSLSKMAGQISVNASPPASEQAPTLPQIEGARGLRKGGGAGMISHELQKYKHLSQPLLVEGHPRARFETHLSSRQSSSCRVPR